MRLLKASDRQAWNAHDPYFAETQVRMALQRNRSSLEGLDELLREHYSIHSDREILAAVRNGDWVLVTDSSAATASGSLLCPAPEPQPVYLRPDPWPDPAPRTDLVFAKSISSAPWGTTQAGSASEPAGNFGKTMLMASSATEVGLGRVAGERLLRSFAWSVQMAGTAARTVGGPAGQVLLLAMTPTRLGSATTPSTAKNNCASCAPPPPGCASSSAATARARCTSTASTPAPSRARTASR